MKRNSSSIAFFYLTALFIPFFLQANEIDSHVAVGERLPSAEEIVFSTTTAEEKNINEDSASDGLVKNDNFFAYIFDSYPSAYYPPSIHWLSGISAFGDSIELEDGSTWKVSDYDRYKANNWRSEDPLLITQNHRWFSKYSYRIINKNSGASVETNLYFGPIKNGEYTLYIFSIDRVKNTIKAINGKNEITHWEICSKDWHEFDEWEPNDAIIVGYNSGWDSRYECILINVNMDNFVRAKQF